MRVSYVGEVANNSRLAIISYDESKESEKVNKVVDKLVNEGWKVDFGEDEEICFRVCDRYEIDMNMICLLKTTRDLKNIVR